MSISYFGIFVTIALHRAVQCILARSSPESKAISPGVPAVLGAASRCSNERWADANAGSGTPWSSAIVHFEMRIRREAGGHRGTSAVGCSLQEAAGIFFRSEGCMISFVGISVVPPHDLCNVIAQVTTRVSPDLCDPKVQGREG
jgi:hypothetical protein